MLPAFITNLFGSRNDRILKKYWKTVEQINALESSFTDLSDDQLQAKTAEFQQQLADGATVDDLLVPAFATVREASKRVMNMRHYDVQLIGAMVLNNGNIAEMRTGEGKTLVATLAVYLNALAGKGAHVITVNDYLAKRDAQWMGKLYGWLGLSTGVVVSGQSHDEKQQAYACDITYGTNNEFGFDYLRDNMAFTNDQRVQRELNFAVVDEVDSILIDEARTPLIISGQAEDNADTYRKIREMVPLLEGFLLDDTLDKHVEPDGDFTIDEKAKQILLTEQGHEKVEHWLAQQGLIADGSSLYDVGNIMLMHHVTAALKAEHLFVRNKDYVVENGQVVIIDEFTGRKMAGRRWSEGLHQAVEAKEGASIQAESQTLASITFQNYFRLYDKLSGMTGTADTEAAEFKQIYDLEVVIVPSNKVPERKDYADLVYLGLTGKYKAIVVDIKDCVARQQPVLVGTASIETSEFLSKLLDQANIRHEVLNAKQHEREAHIIANAGRPGRVTIATNMAGRGTDIVLGGSLEAELAELGSVSQTKVDQVTREWQTRHDAVLASGGLHVIGSERHESRRIDNQLRGRSGRQGDPGSSRFYLSMEDDLMRMFASDGVRNMMQRLGMSEDEAIEHGMVTRAIANAQKKVEGRNFDIRKQLLEFDDVANDQRKVVYSRRADIMALDSVADEVDDMRETIVNDIISVHIAPNSFEEQWEIAELEALLHEETHEPLPLQAWLDDDHELNEYTLRQKIVHTLRDRYQQKVQLVGDEQMRHFEKSVYLQTLDNLWREHLAAMDRLRQGIHLRGYAQKNPVQEYKRESFELFQQFLYAVEEETVRVLTRVRIEPAEATPPEVHMRQNVTGVKTEHASMDALADQPSQAEPAEKPDITVRRDVPKVGRNDPCPCGSGKKYKHCHGKL